MKTAHEGLGITEGDWSIAVDLFTAALQKWNVPAQAQVEFMQIIENMKSQIVEVLNLEALFRPSRLPCASVYDGSIRPPSSVL